MKYKTFQLHLKKVLKMCNPEASTFLRSWLEIAFANIAICGLRPPLLSSFLSELLVSVSALLAQTKSWSV